MSTTHQQLTEMIRTCCTRVLANQQSSEGDLKTAAKQLSQTGTLVLTELEAAEGRIPHINTIVADVFEIEPDDLMSNHRGASIALARQVAMYFYRRNSMLTQEQVGALFGGREHSTVSHAERLVEELQTTDEFFAAQIRLIEKRLNQKNQQQPQPATSAR